MGSKNVKKEYMEYVKKECKIHVDKPAGTEHCMHTVMGDTVSLCTMLASLFSSLNQCGAIDFNDLRNIIDIAEGKGAKDESK